MDSIDEYLSGTSLYGDDFSDRQIEDWYLDEKEGYANLGAADGARYRYAYHAWNAYHAYRHLKETVFRHALGFGAAYGDEFAPIISKVRQITIADPSDAFVRDRVHGVPARYVKPAPNGELPIDDGTFDFVTCLGALHHIPNVSAVVAEIARTLQAGGVMVLREPIVSMGDWRYPRPGLTKRERGIPLHLLREIVGKAGLVVERESLCAFSLTPRIFRLSRDGPFNSGFATRIDAMFSSAFSWNVRYHAKSLIQRIRPTSVFLILRKPLHDMKR